MDDIDDIKQKNRENNVNDTYDYEEEEDNEEVEKIEANDDDTPEKLDGFKGDELFKTVQLPSSLAHKEWDNEFELKHRGCFTIANTIPIDSFAAGPADADPGSTGTDDRGVVHKIRG
ncbi:hypothetical protein QCA50_019729 [Cerrena zonata]|uniref:Uncharacterized protein n=1 Tax=Cerrena zonata TaxID=2478898 RepID=A0AAW0FBQ0_9APHY